VSCIDWVQAGDVWVQAGDVWVLRVLLFHVCPKSVYCSCVRRGWPAQFAIRFLTIFWFPFLLCLAPLRAWALLDDELCLSSAHPFSYYYLLPYHFIILAAKLFASILLGFFGPVICFLLGVLDSFAFLGLTWFFS